jgi:hypothetical protein
VFVTAQSDAYVDLSREVADGLRALGLDVREVDGILTIDGSRVALHLVTRAHPTPADVQALVETTAGQLPAMLVADRISEPGRAALRQAGWGWLDRRGHLRIWTPGARVEAPLPGAGGATAVSVTNPWTTVGLEVALAALIEPAEQVRARRVAPILGRSVGAVHERIASFVDLGLIGPSTRRPLLPELFWETAAHWPDDGWQPLPVGLDDVAEAVGNDVLVRVDERAATLGGARIPAAGDLPARCYVPAASGLRRALRLADREGDRAARSWVRAAPVSWLPTNDDHPPDASHPWFVAHPIVCALRLARDPARGREVVDAWGIVPGEAT